MAAADDPVLIEVDPRQAANAYRAFEAWAGAGRVMVVFEPDTMMAVDRPGRRGLLYDEVHVITVWAGDGGQQLLDLLRAQDVQADRPTVVVKPSAEEPDPGRMLALVLEHGSPIDEVRHLI